VERLLPRFAGRPQRAPAGLPGERAVAGERRRLRRRD
jgi:hypothetical protein